MRNLLKLILSITILAIVSCEEQLPEPIAVTSVSLNAETVEMTEGNELTLIATVSPKDADNKSVIWSSSNLSIASVDDGKITAHKAGKATITVKTDDGGKTATCDVVVVAKVFPVKEVSLDKKSIEVTLGDEFTLTATIKPDNATNKNLLWSSSNSQVASVNEGHVVTHQVGKVTITAKSEDGGKSASCDVVIKEKVYPVTGVTLDNSSVELTEGDEFTLTASISPDNATNKNVTWSSSNSSVASVSNGKVTALKAGKATIKVKTDDGGKTATCEVKVNEKVYPVTGVTLSKTSATLTEGEELTLTATITPDNATNKKLTWSSSNSSVASVVNGKVTALKAGYTTVSVKTEEGNKTANCDITVVEPPKAASLSLSESSINGYIYRDHSKLYRVSVSAYPSNAVTDYEWSSSNTRVAKVEGYGNSAEIYTEDYGETIITVTDKRTGLSASMTIHTLVEDFAWNESASETMYGYPMITVYLNEEHKLNYSYTPSYATKIFSDLSQFVFYEDNYVVDTPTVISISEDGVVTGLKIGVVGIKPTGLVVRSEETGRLYIKVKDRYTPVIGISLNKTYLSMTQYDTETLSVTISPSDATDKSVTWVSDNPSVAKVDSKGLVTAVSGGSAVITVRSEDSSLTASCTVSVTADSHEAVDLGLSVKWATCNYNAASSYEVGGYYLWGDPTGNAKIGFDIVGSEIVPLYSAPNMDSIAGTSYDIVRAKWGGKWRLPSMTEFNELYSKCTWTYTSQNGVNGIKITGPNGNSIFLPMTGYACPDDGPVGAYEITDSSSGYYMTSQSYKDSYGRFAYSCQIKSNTSYSLPSWRVGFAGFPIRPVR